MKKVYLAFAVVLTLGLFSCVGGDMDPPARVSDLTYVDHVAALIYGGRVQVGDTSGLPDTRILAWTAPGDDGREGEASIYDVRYVRQEDLDRWGLSTNPNAALINHWNDARRLVNEPYPDNSGGLGQLFLPRVFSAEDIWIAMQALDETGQASTTSNIIGPIRVAPVFLPLRSSAGATVAGFGSVVHYAGDLDGNGYADMIVGSPALGRVTLHPGGSTKKLTERVLNANGVHVLGALAELLPDCNIIGEPADQFGAAVTGLARVTDDRRFEFAAGAPARDNGATIDAGAIYIFHGRKQFPDVIDADSAYAIIPGTEAGGRLGASLSAATNFAGDDTLNFVAGAPGAGGTGAAYVFRAGIKDPASDLDAIVVVRGAAAGDELGAEVEIIGDVNGDGIADVAIGAPGHDNGVLADAGAVYIFYGGDKGVMHFSDISGQRVIDLSAQSADVILLGSVAGRRFGQTITVGGDLADNDTPGRDFAVGGIDTAFIFYGGDTETTTPFPLNGSGVSYNDASAAVRLTGPAGSGFGSVVVGPGDLDRDNVYDLAVAVPGLEEVWLFYGPIDNLGAPTEKIKSPSAGIGFGSGLASPGDINLDGFPDLVIAGPGAGQAYISF